MTSDIIKQMYIAFISFNLLLNSTCVVCNPVSDFCPDGGKAHHGEWSLEYKDGYRCILKCHHGYTPSGCNVLRKVGYEVWNHDVTTCQEENWIFNKRSACIGTVAVVIVSSPILLKAAGVLVVGIVAGSLATRFMSWTNDIQEGSVFAYLQSLGMKGISKESFTLLISPVGKTCDGVISYLYLVACNET